MLRPFREGRAFSEWGEGGVRDPPLREAVGSGLGPPPPSWHLGEKIFGAAEIFSPFGPQRRIFLGSQIFAIEKRGGGLDPFPQTLGGGPDPPLLLAPFFARIMPCEVRAPPPIPFRDPGDLPGYLEVFSYPTASVRTPWLLFGTPGGRWDSRSSFGRPGSLLYPAKASVLVSRHFWREAPKEKNFDNFGPKKFDFGCVGRRPWGSGVFSGPTPGGGSGTPPPTTPHP